MKNMMNNLRFVFCVMAFSLVSTMTFAQTSITGIVLDAANAEPIIGANIIEKGTTNGTITDFDGNFFLNVAEGAILEISYMGYKTVELPATNGMQVQLGEDTELLEDLIVAAINDAEAKAEELKSAKLGGLGALGGMM